MLTNLIGFQSSTADSILAAGFKYESLTLSEERFVLEIMRQEGDESAYYEFTANFTRPIDNDARISLYLYLSNGFIHKFILKDYSQN
jgi:uncharacterized tellurite resistance protein B-like protein